MRRSHSVEQHCAFFALGYAGRDINVNSPKQLGEVLSDDVGLTPM